MIGELRKFELISVLAAQGGAATADELRERGRFASVRGARRAAAMMIAAGLYQVAGARYQLTELAWQWHRDPASASNGSSNGATAPAPAEDDADQRAWLAEASRYTDELIAAGEILPAFPTATPILDSDGDLVSRSPDGTEWLCPPGKTPRCFFRGNFWEARDGRVLYLLCNEHGQELGPGPSGPRVVGDAMPSTAPTPAVQPQPQQPMPQTAAPRPAGWYQTPSGVRRYWDGSAGWEVDTLGRTVRLPPPGIYPMPGGALTWDGLCWVGP